MKELWKKGKHGRNSQVLKTRGGEKEEVCEGVKALALLKTVCKLRGARRPPKTSGSRP